MMRSSGFTLIDLLISLAILSILLMIGIPNFFSQIQKSRVDLATQTLLESIDLTRTRAVFSNARATIRNKSTWEDGWEIFSDQDNDGIFDGDEKMLQQHEKLTGVRIHTNRPVQNYISYIGSGEGAYASGTGATAFLAGTISICPLNEGAGFQLILSKGGRVKKIEIDAATCATL